MLPVIAFEQATSSGHDAVNTTLNGVNGVPYAVEYTAISKVVFVSLLIKPTEPVMYCAPSPNAYVVPYDNSRLPTNISLNEFVFPLMLIVISTLP